MYTIQVILKRLRLLLMRFGDFYMAKMFSFGDVSSGQIFQLGIVVADIEASMRLCTEALRIGPFTCMRGFKAPDGWYRGGTDMPELTIAHAYAGRFFIEFIQQHDATPSVYKEYIDQFGYGLHHYGIAIAPDDYDKTLNHFYGMGFENVFTDRLPSGARIRYIGPKGEGAIEKLRKETGVGYLECVEVVEGEDEFFKGMYEASLKRSG